MLNIVVLNPSEEVINSIIFNTNLNQDTNLIVVGDYSLSNKFPVIQTKDIIDTHRYITGDAIVLNRVAITQSYWLERIPQIKHDFPSWGLVNGIVVKPMGSMLFSTYAGLTPKNEFRIGWVGSKQKLFIPEEQKFVPIKGTFIRQEVVNMVWDKIELGLTQPEKIELPKDYTYGYYPYLMFKEI